MAHYDHLFTIPGRAASQIDCGVALVGGFPTAAEEFRPAASAGQDVIGMSIATVASPGDPVAVAIHGVVKAIAAASVGAMTRVAAASVNGALGPITSSGLSTALGSALGAAGARYSVGLALTPAAAGEVFAVLLDQRQLI